MGKYKPYPEYKGSGVEWLGDVPEGWRLEKLKYFASVQPSNVDKKTKENERAIRLCNYTDVYYQDEISSKIDFMKASATEEQIAKFTLCKGDIIITKDSEDPNDIAVPAYVSEDLDSVLCGYHLAMIRSKNRAVGGYIKRQFESMYVRSYFATRANGLTRYGLGTYPLTNILLPLPPLEEQKRIAAFLDHETTQIDFLIEKQEKLIELLKEKRQAVISHTVTKGLNPDAPMKDSGVEWLGEVPEHWEVKRLKHIASLQSGIAKGKDLSKVESITVPYLRVANVQDGYVNLEDVAEIDIQPHELERYLLKEGDVLMNEGGDNDKLGRGTVWNAKVAPCIHQNHVFAIRPHAVEPEWLACVTRASSTKFYFFSKSKQSTNLASISATNILETPVTVPPYEERGGILEYLEKVSIKLDKLSEAAKTKVALLKERRTALISAAVTGKIDVRDWNKD